MNARQMVYGGILISVNIEAAINARAEHDYPHGGAQREAFELGAIASAAGRSCRIGAGTPAAEAWRCGQDFGATLRRADSLGESVWQLGVALMRGGL